MKATPTPGGPVEGPPLLAHHAVTAGDAEPERWMLVLHGVYGAGRNWASVARRFVRARPAWGALLVDLRLHGGSQGFPPPHTLEACARDVGRLTSALCLGVGAVLGHSFGGKVALLHARNAVEAAGTPPEGVWVVDSSPGAHAPGGSAWRMLRALRRHPGPFASRREGVHAVESNGFPTPVAQWMATNLVEAPGDGGWTWLLDVDGIEDLLVDFFGTDAWAVVESPPAGAELHVVKAEGSGVLDEEACGRVEAAGRTTGRARLHRVPGGHWVNADAPDDLHRLLVEWTP